MHIITDDNAKRHHHHLECKRRWFGVSNYVQGALQLTILSLFEGVYQSITQTPPMTRKLCTEEVPPKTKIVFQGKFLST